jgi:HEPN domain-containing protein
MASVYWAQAQAILREAEGYLRNRGRLPAGLAERVERLAATSRRLWREREPSMYGDEETDTPPTELYNEFDAHEMLAAARDVMARCAPFLSEPGTAEGGSGGRQRP